MSICSNFDCDGFASSHRRCGRCKRRSILTCAICGMDVYNNKRIFCVVCGISSKAEWAREHQRTLSPEIKRLRHKKYYDTHREEIRENNRQKRINNILSTI